MEVLPTSVTVNSQSTGVVRRLRAAVNGLPGVVGVSGVGAIQLDYAHAVYGNFPLVILVLVLLTFVALARAFRSVLLAIKAVMLNLISLGATFGAMTLVWQQGHGSQAIFGISQTGAITFWVPIMVFAFLYGLSMDYEVFILSRMRESYDKNGRTGDAVVEGLGRTGRLVTSAALILFLAFLSLASSPGTDIKVLATGLGAGILLDATVVRALLVPALVTLFGRFNWWLPSVVAKPLFVQPHAAVVEVAERHLFVASEATLQTFASLTHHFLRLVDRGHAHTASGHAVWFQLTHRRPIPLCTRSEFRCGHAQPDRMVRNCTMTANRASASPRSTPPTSAARRSRYRSVFGWT